MSSNTGHDFSRIPNDTSPEAEGVQIELLRKAGPTRRFQLMLSLTQRAMELSRRAIARTNPGLSDFELKILYLEHCYGKELAEKVRTHMMENKIHESH